MGWLTDAFFGHADPDSNREYEERLARQMADKPIESRSGTKTLTVTSTEPGIVTATTAPPDPFRTSSGAKVLPKLAVRRVEPHLSGDGNHLDLWIHLKNESDFEIEITRVDILNQHVDAGRFLKSGEQYEMCVYRGDTPANDTYRKAYVKFKIVENGDYFQQEFRIDYEFEDDGHGKFYIPNDLEVVNVARDI